MDFGLTDDQGDIQRTARDLLARRATAERVREHAEAARSDDELWRELAGLGWPGIAVAEEHGGDAREGVAALVPGGEGAGVFVLVGDGAARVVTPEDAEVTLVASIDSTRPAARWR